jgi:hypothetical protein
MPVKIQNANGCLRWVSLIILLKLAHMVTDTIAFTDLWAAVNLRFNAVRKVKAPAGGTSIFFVFF